tara:strand:- start:7219 stop:7611 length:393 start_codon:yes stop_codon:yes gene_type:complete
MNNIEQIEITLIVTGKKQKKQVSWLITDKADWFNDANPFLITDSKIASKLYGEFSGKPIRVRMLSKYPYLKSRIEDYEDEQIEKDSTAPVGDIEPTETTEAETTNQGGVEQEESIKPQPKKRGRKPNTKK